MKLLVDEDTQAHRLLGMLRQAGLDVVCVAELDKNGQPDEVIFQTAQVLQRTILTHNILDFETLGREAPGHAGIIGIFRDKAPRKSMSHVDIVRALERLQTSGLPLDNQLHILNHWR